MRNQFGQEIEIGDWVGHVTRSGSNLYRKVGRVEAFGYRKSPYHGTETVIVRPRWVKSDCSWDKLGLSPGVGINTVFKIEPIALD